MLDGESVWLAAGVAARRFLQGITVYGFPIELIDLHNLQKWLENQNRQNNRGFKASDLHIGFDTCP